jgi:hypothetical protein
VADDSELLGESKRPVVLEALRVSLGRPAVWLTTWWCMALIVLCLSLPFVGALMEHVGSYAPGSQFFSLSTTFRFDHGSDLGAVRGAVSSTAAGVGFLALFFGVFAAGGWLQVILERTHGQSLRRFFLGGSRYFFRFFRVLLITLLALHVLGWVLYEWPWEKLVLQGLFGVPESDLSSLETLDSERTYANLAFAQDGLYALGFALVLVWGLYTRTRIALNDTSSALIAGIASLYTIVRHPLKTLRPMLLLALLEASILVGLGFATDSFQSGMEEKTSLVSVLILLGLGQLGLLIREALRGAGYCAAVRVSQDLVGPEREDPWTGSIGGPGGPRYPIGDGDDDEYGVSM